MTKHLPTSSFAQAELTCQKSALVRVLAKAPSDVIHFSNSNNNELLFIDLATVPADKILLSRLPKVDFLRKENASWFLLLLSLPPYPNYFLTADKVEFYIQNKWKHNKDGDYKTATTFPDNKFFTIEQFKNKIEKLILANTDDIFESEIPDKSCHRMIHRKKGFTLTLEELRTKLTT